MFSAPARKVRPAFVKALAASVGRSPTRRNISPASSNLAADRVGSTRRSFSASLRIKAARAVSASFASPALSKHSTAVSYCPALSICKQPRRKHSTVQHSTKLQARGAQGESWELSEWSLRQPRLLDTTSNGGGRV